MDLLMSCGRRDEHARMLRPVWPAPTLDRVQRGHFPTSRHHRGALATGHGRAADVATAQSMWPHVVTAVCCVPPAGRCTRLPSDKCRIRDGNYCVRLWSLEKASTAFSIFHNFISLASLTLYIFRT